MANNRLTSLRDEAVAIFRAAIAAVDPQQLVANHLSRRGSEVLVQTGSTVLARWDAPTLVVGAGKAAARMAAGCEQMLDAQNVRGEVIVADGCSTSLQSIVVSEAGHPLPDERGAAATGRFLERMQRHDHGGILCLISGGASSLLVRPRAPVNLTEKIHTTQLLLESGADIASFNTVRKHLSEAKGGGLLRIMRTTAAALLISDVVGDDPGTIGSGPTAADPTTFADAWAVLERLRLLNRMPAAVTTLLREGMEGRVADTVKQGTPEADRCCNITIGSNRTALEGAAREARRRGWTAIVEPTPLTGDSAAAARGFGLRLRELARRGAQDRLVCVLAGGETTVRVRGTGRGGRNQEFALALGPEVSNEAMLVLSAGTDGIDGPTTSAGAFVDGTTLRRATERGVHWDAALANNDSHTFFSKLGDLFACGPTGTNVMDIKIALLTTGSARTVPGPM